MIQFVAHCQTPLAVAARALAHTLAPIELDPLNPSTKELVLIRYAKATSARRFTYRDIVAANGSPVAMWTDCITSHANDLVKIMDFDISSLIKKLQVVRLGVPAPFDIGEHRRRPAHLRWVQVKALKHTPGGNEFFLNFDIHPEFVAEIPLNLVDGNFVLDTAHVNPPASQTPLPPTSYMVKTGSLDIVDCLLS